MSGIEFFTSLAILSLSFAISFSVFLRMLCGILSADDSAVMYPSGPNAFLIFFFSISLNDTVFSGVSFSSFLGMLYSDDIMIGARMVFNCLISSVSSCFCESVNFVSLVMWFNVWSSIHELLFHVFMLGFWNTFVNPVRVLMS